MGNIKFLIPGIALSLLAGYSASAHHNPGYYFNMGQTVIHENATVVEFSVANPHGRLTYTMVAANGSEKEWVAELPANNMMRRYGVTENSIGAGDLVTLRGNPGRNGATMLRVTHVLMPDSSVTTFYAPQGSGSPEDFQPH